jgi:hypothetical protein
MQNMFLRKRSQQEIVQRNINVALQQTRRKHRPARSDAYLSPWDADLARGPKVYPIDRVVDTP